MEEETLIFYHGADFDGKCSAAIFSRAIGDHAKRLSPIDYGDDFPWGEIKPKQRVIMVDFSLPVDDMDRLNTIADLLWVDHHKTAIEAMDKLNAVEGVREIGRAACELCWELLYPKTKTPLAVTYLGRYDAWDTDNALGWENHILPFQYGLRAKRMDPEWDIEDWVDLFNDDTRVLVNRIKDRGRAILDYNAVMDAGRMKNSFEIYFCGLRVIAINGGHGSQQFKSVWDQSKYDAMLTFSNIRGAHWKVSMYTDKAGVDVSAVCKEHGGGGHTGAAGFICTELPFPVVEQ